MQSMEDGHAERDAIAAEWLGGRRPNATLSNGSYIDQSHPKADRLGPKPFFDLDRHE
jgi:hypothetical protein